MLPFSSIESPGFDYSGDVCVTFYYHMYGAEMGTLLVYRSNLGIESPLWEISGDQGNSWKFRSIETSISRGEKVSDIHLLL